jgi:hypothetical protein
MRFSMVVGPFDRDNRWLNEAHPEEACHRIDDCSRLCVYGDFLRWGSQPARHWGFVHSETHPLNGFYAVIGILHWMKLTVSQQIVLGLVVILVLCLLVVWAALRKPVERKKVFAMSSLILRHKKRAWDVAFRNPRPFSSVVGSWKVYADFSVTAKCTHDFLLPTRSDNERGSAQMKLSLDQRIVISLLVFLVICLLIFWLLLDKPVQTPDNQNLHLRTSELRTYFPRLLSNVCRTET